MIRFKKDTFANYYKVLSSSFSLKVTFIIKCRCHNFIVSYKGSNVAACAVHFLSRYLCTNIFDCFQNKIVELNVV